MHNIIAAPVVKLPLSTMPAPAYTDFVHIYVCDSANKEEERLLIDHEQAHIWLAHKRRGTQLERTVTDFDMESWKMACELEIARNIYTDEDIDLINRPFSVLHGAVLPDSIEELPSDILIAEDIYDWLVNNKHEYVEDTCACMHSEDTPDEACEGNNTTNIASNVEEMISDVKQALIDRARQNQTEEDTQTKLKEIKHRPPSLSSALDAILRTRVERETSYRRTARRCMDGNIILKGRVTKAHSPLVEIFLDRSGSFNASKTQQAEQVLQKVLNRYNTSIEKDVWYFGSGKITDKDFSGGDTPYHLIAEHLYRTQPKIAIIITDNDSCGEVDIKLFSNTSIIVIPIDCTTTSVAKQFNGVEVTI